MKYISLPLFGLISGLIVNFLMYTVGLIDTSYGEPNLPNLITPGLTFGLCLFIWFRLYKYKTYKTVLWIFASTVAYIFSYFTAFFLVGWLVGDEIGYLVAGLLGGTIITLAFNNVVPLSGKYFYLVIGLAGLIAYVWALIAYVWAPIDYYGRSYVENHSLLYLSWQTFVSLALAIAIKRDTRDNREVARAAIQNKLKI